MSAYIEIQFKGNRRLSFTNPLDFPVRLGDSVIVEAEKGEDIGRVVQITEVDRISDAEDRANVRPILRKAGPHDYQRQKRNTERESSAEDSCRQLIRDHRLRMKLVNVEYQLDGKKVTFFFTAEGRVDFRNLVKDLAAQLRTRIDLRQIGARDEAKKFGGYGPCGQRQCCSSFLHRFDPITTSMAKAQNLPLNPIKLSGNCGRLKCCLRYELDFYKTEFARYPSLDTAVETLKGISYVDKIDIFQEEVTIRYTDGDTDVVSRKQLMDFMAFKPGESNCKSGCGNPEARKDGKAKDDNTPRSEQESAPRETSSKRSEQRPEKRNSERREEGRRQGAADSRENPEERRDADRRTLERRSAANQTGENSADRSRSNRGPRRSNSRRGTPPRGRSKRPDNRRDTPPTTDKTARPPENNDQ